MDGNCNLTGWQRRTNHKAVILVVNRLAGIFNVLQCLPSGSGSGGSGLELC